MIHVANIDWDTDEDIELPTDVDIPLSELIDDDEDTDDVDIGDRVCDYLSDKYGFCVYGFSISE